MGYGLASMVERGGCWPLSLMVGVWGRSCGVARGVRGRVARTTVLCGEALAGAGCG